MKKNSKKIYFGKVEEDAIKKYLDNNISEEEKKDLYENIIHPTFERLAENILNTYGLKYGFFNIGYSNKDLIDIGVSYMFSRISMFDPQRKSKKHGNYTKAFSYFGTILKRFYIKESIEKHRDTERKVEINYNEDENNSTPLYYEPDFNNDDNIFFNMLISWFEKNKEIYFMNNEIPILDAILTLLKNRNRIENFNKKYLYIQIREIAGIDTLQITRVVNKMKKYYKHLRWNYINHGELISGSIDI